MKEDLKQVANNSTHLISEERNQLIRLFEEFEDLFDGTLGDWDIEPVNLEINPGSKPFNSKYYPWIKINKEIFCKELIFLVETGVLTMVQQIQ